MFIALVLHRNVHGFFFFWGGGLGGVVGRFANCLNACCCQMEFFEAFGLLFH